MRDEQVANRATTFFNIELSKYVAGNGSNPAILNIERHETINAAKVMRRVGLSFAILLGLLSVIVAAPPAHAASHSEGHEHPDHDHHHGHKHQQPAVTSSSCNWNVVLANAPTPGSGTLRYYCSPTSGAFTVSKAGHDTPIFNAPSAISGVGFVSHSAGSCSGFTPLTSGSTITLSSTGDFDLCASYSCPTGCGSVAAWTFNWKS